MSRENKRLQFEFTAEAVEGLDRLVDELGAASRAEVVRRALKLLFRAIDEQRNGGALYVRSRDGRERELHIL